MCDFDGVKPLWIALSLYTLFGRVLFWRLFQVWELFLSLLWVSYWCLSTFGFLSLSIAEVTRGPWVKFKKDYPWEMLVLYINGLGQNVRRELLNLYDKRVNGKKINEMEFKSLPQEFAQPSTRKIIDEEICRTLGLEVELDTLYEMLSNEPMLTG